MLPDPVEGVVRMKYVRLVVPVYVEKLVPVEARVEVPVMAVKAASAATATLTVVVPVVVPNCACARDAVSSRPSAERSSFFFMVSSPIFPPVSRYAARIVI
jgi:hypothetical protein